MKDILTASWMVEMIRTTTNMYNHGWDERNGGNVSLLLSEAEVHHSLTFTIPYSRIQLADYLNCDRSALSRELSLMQRDGLLETYKSSFKLLEPDALRHMVL